MAIDPSSLPTIFASSALPRATLSRWHSAERVRRVAPGVYTTDLEAPLDHLVRSRLWEVVACVVADAVVCDRTALEARPAADGSVFVIARRKRDAGLPGGITIRPRDGAPHIVDSPPAIDDMPLPGGIFMCSRARALLENCRSTRPNTAGISRTLSKAELEALLEKLMRTSGSDALNALRDQARAVANALSLEREFAVLNELIGSLQGTRSGRLRTAQGRARGRGAGYDADRLALFGKLHERLRSRAPVQRLAPPGDAPQVEHLPFFEAYFSNFIEGTEFRLEEAAAIVYEGAEPAERPEDAHDVKGTWAILNDEREMAQLPRDADDFLDLLCSRHAVLMAGRSDKLPGQFKQAENWAGGTHFVRWELVPGTLRGAFEFYASLETAFERACYVMFVTAEVHPFVDGNGRTARIMMNAELAAAGEWRIIVPTVYRNNYLQALRALTHNARTDAIDTMLEFAQRYTAAIDFRSIDLAEALLERTNAFVDSNDADQRGIRLQLPSPADYESVKRHLDAARSPAAQLGEQATVVHAIWLPRHRSFQVELGDGIELEATTSPTYGEQMWLLIGGERMSVKTVGVPLEEVARFRHLLERVHHDLESEGDAAVIGRDYAIGMP